MRTVLHYTGLYLRLRSAEHSESVHPPPPLDEQPRVKRRFALPQKR